MLMADQTGSAMTKPVRFDLAGYARDGQLGGHDALIRLAERADALGFGGIWFNEFHFRRKTVPYPSTLLLGAAILARTERLRFGTSILVLPLHHPLLIAEQIAQLDYQSGGRIDVGVGRGTEPSTFAALGLPIDEAKSRFAEALRAMIAVWTQETASSHGPVWPFTDVSVGPPPLQHPHPPIHIAASSSETLDIAAQHGFPLLLSLEPNELRQITAYRAALDRAGLDDAPLRASSLSRYVIVGRTAAEATTRLDHLVGRLNQARAERAQSRGVAAPPPRTRSEMLEGYVIAGTPAACRSQLQTLFAADGITNLRCLFSANGLISLEDACDSMKRFAAEVMPAFTGEAAINTISHTIRETT
jgi:alkanesulfonate monooxygenase SsuD/methylene tetrahydromethanopterin reductase-like flavin-dependent oxidoreductase (luciferase family)